MRYSRSNLTTRVKKSTACNKPKQQKSAYACGYADIEFRVPGNIDTNYTRDLAYLKWAIVGPWHTRYCTVRYCSDSTATGPGSSFPVLHLHPTSISKFPNPPHRFRSRVPESTKNKYLQKTCQWERLFASNHKYFPLGPQMRSLDPTKRQAKNPFS